MLFTKKKKDRKKRQKDLKQQMSLLWLPRDPSPFHEQDLRYIIKLFLAETYSYLPDVPLREKCHLFDINDTMPGRSYLWDNYILFDIPENTIK